MADLALGSLTAATSIGGSDLLYAVISGNSRKITRDNAFKDIAAVAIGGATLGSDVLAVTGTVSFNSAIACTSISASAVTLGSTGGNGYRVSGGGFMIFQSSGVLKLSNTIDDGWSLLQLGGTTSAYPAIGTDGVGVKVIAADGTTGAFLCGVEQTAPSAPASNGYRMYAEDNGSGKTRLMVIFASGAAQQLAIQP